MSRNQEINKFDLSVVIGIIVIVFTVGLVIFLSRRVGEGIPVSRDNSRPEASSSIFGDDAEDQKNGILSVKNKQASEPSKLRVEILKEGAGEGAKIRDRVKVNYVGVLEDGAKFDSSYDRKAPFEFTLGAGEVIKGWDEGVLGMKIGEKRKIVVPPELGYGALGVPGAIPPGATLIFEVERL